MRRPGQTGRGNPVVGIRLKPTQRTALEAMAAERQETLSELIREMVLQGMTHDDTMRLRTHLRQTVQLLELYHDSPDS